MALVDERKAGESAAGRRPPDRRAADFGARLREARERKGVSLREIANATKISIRALEALERNDISHLPGGIFSRSFVRAYAHEAGLDPDETVDDFIRQFPHDSVTAGHATSVRVDDIDDESNRRTARVVVRLIGISVPVAAVVLYFVLAGRHAASVKVEPVAAAAGRIEATSPASAVSVVVEVTALRSCLLTSGVDGEPMTAARLEAGGRQSFHVQNELMLTVSDPSAVEVTLNGLRSRSLGASGVMTTVRLTPDNYRDFLAIP